MKRIVQIPIVFCNTCMYGEWSDSGGCGHQWFATTASWSSRTVRAQEEFGSLDLPPLLNMLLLHSTQRHNGYWWWIMSHWLFNSCIYAVKTVWISMCFSTIVSTDRLRWWYIASRKVVTRFILSSDFRGNLGRHGAMVVYLAPLCHAWMVVYREQKCSDSSSCLWVKL